MLRFFDVLGKDVIVEAEALVAVAEVRVGSDVERNVIVVDWVLHLPVPTRESVVQVGPALEPSSRNLHQVARRLHADVYRFDFIAPLVLVRPPYACAFLFTCGIHERPAHRICAEDEAAESSHLHRMTRVVKIHRVYLPLVQCAWKVDIDRSATDTLPGQGRRRAVGIFQGDSINTKRWHEVELNTLAILQHPESDGIHSTQKLLGWIHPHMQVVMEKVIVRAIRAVATEEFVATRKSRGDGAPARGWRCLGASQGEGRREQECHGKQVTSTRLHLEYLYLENSQSDARLI